MTLRSELFSLQAESNVTNINFLLLGGVRINCACFAAASSIQSGGGVTDGMLNNLRSAIEHDPADRGIPAVYLRNG